jgi:chemotaxis protein histidine kinase CheA
MSSPFISCPEFLKLERSIIEEFFACTRESNIEAASCIQALNQQANADDINRLFRALHSLKGNCQMVGLTPFTEPLHRIEDIVAKIRSGDLPYAPIVGDFLILATDEIEDLLEELISTSQANNIRRERLCLISQNLLNQLRPENIQQEFERALSELDGRIKTTKQEQKSKNILLEVPADLEN